MAMEEINHKQLGTTTVEHRISTNQSTNIVSKRKETAETDRNKNESEYSKRVSNLLENTSYLASNKLKNILKIMLTLFMSRCGLGLKGLCDGSKGPYDIPYNVIIKNIQKGPEIPAKAPFLHILYGRL
jgi:hypothetical protein